MAAYRRRTATTYDTYGSVAYAPAYDGSAVRVPRRQEEVLQPAPRPRQREQVRRRALERTQVQVREAGQVAAVFAALLILSYAQLAVANDAMVTLRGQLSDLQAEHATLSAQYEKVFDMDKLQAAVGGEMARPDSDQVTYIDLSEPDQVTVYAEERAGGLSGVLTGAGRVLDGFLEYFR